MSVSNRGSRFPLAAAAVLTAMLAVGSSAPPAQAQTVVDPVEALARVVGEHGHAEAPVVLPAVLSNKTDVERLARRWYRSLDGTSTLGEGSVVVYARVLADGTVTEAFVPRTSSHHPVLNGLGRRLAMTMQFSPVAVDNAPIGTGAPGARGYWVAQRITFGR